MICSNTRGKNNLKCTEKHNLTLMQAVYILFNALLFCLTPCVITGLQERSGGKRHRPGSSQSYTFCKGGNGARGLPLLLGHRCPDGLGEYVHFS